MSLRRGFGICANGNVFGPGLPTETGKFGFNLVVLRDAGHLAGPLLGLVQGEKDANHSCLYLRPLLIVRPNRSNPPFGSSGLCLRSFASSRHLLWPQENL